MSSKSLKNINVGSVAGATKGYGGTLVIDFGEMNYDGHVSYIGALGSYEPNMAFANSSINVLNVSDNGYL